MNEIVRNIIVAAALATGAFLAGGIASQSVANAYGVKTACVGCK